MVENLKCIVDALKSLISTITTMIETPLYSDDVVVKQIRDILDILVQVQCMKQDPLTLTKEIRNSLNEHQLYCSLLRLHFYYVPN